MIAPLDTHALIASRDFAAFPLAPGVDPKELADAPLSENVADLLDGAELSGAVLVQRGRHYGFDNRLICAVAASDPRVRAIGAVDGRDAACGAEARKMLGLPGVVGLRLMEPEKGANLAWLSGPGALDAWRAVADHGAVMDVHAFPWNRAAVLAALQALLKDFSDLQLVLDNCSNIALEDGPPDYGIDHALARIAECDRVTLKVSAMSFTRLRKAGLDVSEALAALVARFGAEKLCWGSDVLATGATLEPAVQEARNAVATLPRAQAEAVLAGNAQRIFARV